MKTHLLQSENWEKYENLEGHQTFRLKGSDFSALAILHETPLGNYLYCPYGPALFPDSKKHSTRHSGSSETTSPLPASSEAPAPSPATEKALRHALTALISLATEKSVIFIRIEPTTPFSASQMANTAKKIDHTSSKTTQNRLVRHISIKKSQDLDPAHTWILDLTPDEDTLLQAMESRKVRYWRNHQKKGIKLRTTQDPSQITILTDLLKKLGEVDNFTPQDENHLKNQLKSGFATLYIADLTEKPEKPEKTSSLSDTTTKNPPSAPIAAALIYDHDDTRYYAHAATDFEHRKLAAGSIILIQMILDAKKNGQKYYDFWGITTSENKNHPWYGFTQYKKSFGGRQVDYAGTYDLILSPAKYKSYHLFRRANRTLRKLRKKIG